MSSIIHEFPLDVNATRCYNARSDNNAASAYRSVSFLPIIVHLFKSCPRPRTLELSQKNYRINRRTEGETKRMSSNRSVLAVGGRATDRQTKRQTTKTMNLSVYTSVHEKCYWYLPTDKLYLSVCLSICLCVCLSISFCMFVCASHFQSAETTIDSVFAVCLYILCRLFRPLAHIVCYLESTARLLQSYHSIFSWFQKVMCLLGVCTWTQSLTSACTHYKQAQHVCDTSHTRDKLHQTRTKYVHHFTTPSLLRDQCRFVFY